MEWVISDHHWEMSNMFTYDIDRQSVVDKMVRDISLEVREKSGIFFLKFLVGTLNYHYVGILQVFIYYLMYYESYLEC